MSRRRRIIIVMVGVTIIVSTVIMPWAWELSGLPLWFYLVGHPVFCLRFGAMAGQAARRAMDEGL